MKVKFIITVFFIVLSSALLKAGADTSRISHLLREADSIHHFNTYESKKLYDQAYLLTRSLPEGDIKKKYLSHIYFLRAVLIVMDYNYKRYDEADSLLKKAIPILEKLQNWEHLSSAWLYRSAIPYRNGHFSQSEYYIEEALKYAFKTKNYKQITFIYNQSIYLLKAQGNISKALKYAYASLENAEKSGDSILLSKSYYWMSHLKYDLQLYDEALHFINKSVNYSFVKNAFVENTGNLKKSEIYSLYGDILAHHKNFEESKVIYEKAIEYAIQNNNKCEALNAYQGFGHVMNDTHNWEKAESYFKRSAQLSDEMGIAPAYHLVSLAKTYSLMEKKDKALTLVEKFLNLNKTPTPNLYTVDFYKDIYFVYRNAGYPEKALEYYIIWQETSDSLRSTDNKLMMADMERKYQLKKKDAEITQQELALAKSENRQVWLGSLLVLVFFFGIGGIYYVRSRAQREKQDFRIQEKQHRINDMLGAQEEERRRIARELHDGIGQSLAALKIQLQSPSSLSSPFQSAHKVDMLCREIRSLSHQMMPLVLEEKGLEEALEFLLEQSFDMNIVDAQFISHNYKGNLSQTREIHLYRIAQELINNIVRHAAATKVGVQLLESEGRIILIVEDNGSGFDMAHRSEGIGLANINSRIEALHGKMELDSSRGKGTFVRIIIPVSGEEKLSA